jgi:protein-disulfide isomerase
MEKTKLLTVLVAVTLVITLLNFYITFDLNSKFDSITGKVVARQDIQPVPTVPKPQQLSRVQVSVDDDPIKGLKDAPVTIIEFSDFQCPYCERFVTQTLPLIEKNYHRFSQTV